MKKTKLKAIFGIILIAVLALILAATPVFAWGGGEETDVDWDIEVLEDPPYYVGIEVTVVAQANITAEAEANWWFVKDFAEASSEATFTVLAPDGTILYTDSGSNYDFESKWFGAEADASFLFEWQLFFAPEQIGVYQALLEGEASAEQGFSIWVFPFVLGSSSASGGGGVTFRVEPLPPPMPDYFCIHLPDATHCFVYQGKATDGDIDVSDGTWRIQIPTGTWILNPDGSMAKKLVVDENGNILGDIAFVYHHSEYPMYVMFDEVTVTQDIDS